MNKPNLLLLAGGQGIQLRDFTLGNYYPKILISIGNQTLLDRILIDYSSYFDKIGIVVSEKDHAAILEEWISHYHPEKNVDIIMYRKTDGTYNTLKVVMGKNPEYLKHTVVHWSTVFLADYNIDELFSQIVSLNENIDGIIVTDYKPQHRMQFCDQNIVQTTDMSGNIPGIFYFNDWSFIKMDCPSYDIIMSEIDLTHHLQHLLKNDELIIKSHACDIFDISNSLKYCEYIKTYANLTTRYFNNIYINNNRVTKSTTSIGHVLLKREARVYNIANSLKWPFAKMLQYDEKNNRLILENIDGLTVNDFLNVIDLNRIDLTTLQNILEKYLATIDIIHKTRFANLDAIVTQEYIKNNIIKEYITETKNRIKDIKYLIPSLDDTYACINGHIEKIPEFDAIISAIKIWLEDYKCEWGSVHGDPNTSNVMIVGTSSSDLNNQQLLFIDPRGTFGDSELYGDQMYDIAKFVYGLHAYDKFNHDKFFSISTQSTNKPIEVIFEVQYGYPLDTILEMLPYSSVRKKEIGILVGVMFIKLTSYIKNNINKVIASYYYGIYLVNKYLGEHAYEVKRELAFDTKSE